MVLGFLIAPAGHVVFEDPTLAPLEIVPGEQRDHHQPLERHRQVPPHHLGQLVGLALAGEHIAFQLLVVLQLDLEEAGELQGRARRASDRDGRMLVGLEHLVDAPSGDLEPFGGLAVARHQHPVLKPDRQHRGAVGDGVLMAGDRQATEGFQVAGRRIDKVFKADEHSAVAIAGAAGPALELARLFQIELEHYEKLEGDMLSCEGKANKLAQMVRGNLPMAFQGLVVIPLFAGYDLKRREGRIFKYDVTGGRYEETEYHATGSGGKDARDTMKQLYRRGLPEAKVLRIALEALYNAAEEDVGTGGPDRVRGKYNEFEMLRKAGIRHADLKGYTYSREDVTARSLANAYSQSIGSIFSVEPKPLEVELLVVEVGQGDKPNEIYRISYDGSIIDEKGVAAIGGKADALLTFLKARWTAPTISLREALRLSIEALDTVTNQKLGAEGLEVAVLDRTRTGRTFRRIGSAEIKSLLA